MRVDVLLLPNAPADVLVERARRVEAIPWSLADAQSSLRKSGSSKIGRNV